MVRGGLNSDQWDVRGDYQMNEKIHIFGRFSRFTDTLSGATMFGAAGGRRIWFGALWRHIEGANDSVALGTDIALNPKLVTDIRLGYFRYNITTSKFDQDVQTANLLGIPGMNTGELATSGSPSFQLAEVGTTTGTQPANPQSQGPQYGAGLNVDRCNCPSTEKEDQYQIVNNWTKILGTHSIKVGADLRYARNLRVPSDNDRTGILYFSNQPTSNPNLTTGPQGGLRFCHLRLGPGDRFQTLREHFHKCEGVSKNASSFMRRTRGVLPTS